MRKNDLFIQISAWLAFIFGMILLIQQISYWKNWISVKDNYFKQYVYSEYGTLYYEANGKRIYLQNIYNFGQRKIPNNQTVLMYINKDDISEGIYFDASDFLDMSITNPLKGLFGSLFPTVLGLFLILDFIEKKRGKSTIKPVSFVCLFLFIGGIVTVVFQIHNIIFYSKLRSQNNKATATIYSQIFDIKATHTYKPVAYYYVDGEKYIYANKYEQEGTLNNVLGDTFEVYYDKSDPNKVVKKGDIFNLFALVFGIICVWVSYPYIFSKQKMEKQLQVNLKKREQNWKI